MELEELEKEYEKKEQARTPARYGCGAAGSCSGPSRIPPNATADFEDWEDYMQYGMGGVYPRDFHGH